jgi:hypothetical protein
MIPKPFSLPKAAIKNVMSADVSLGPTALTVCPIEPLDHDEMTNIVAPVA